MADAANDIAGKQTVHVAHAEHPIGLTLEGDRLRRVHMDRDGEPTSVDFPFIAHLGAEVVEQGEVLQVLVPPINPVAILVNVLKIGPLLLVVHRVGLRDDLDPFAIDGGIGRIFKMLIGDASRQMLDLIVPFGAAGEILLLLIKDRKPVRQNGVVFAPLEVVGNIGLGVRPEVKRICKIVGLRPANGHWFQQSPFIINPSEHGGI